MSAHAEWLSKSECHGSGVDFSSRPPAGTDPWHWWFAEASARGIVLHVRDLSGDRANAITKWTSSGPAILLNHTLTPAQRRATIAHELHHILIGGVCARNCPQNERIVLRETARWLLPDAALVADELRTKGLVAASVALGVPRYILKDRVEFARAAERRTLAAGEVLASSVPVAPSVLRRSQASA